LTGITFAPIYLEAALQPHGSGSLLRGSSCRIGFESLLRGRLSLSASWRSFPRRRSPRV